MKYDFDGDGKVGVSDRITMLKMFHDMPKFIADCDHDGDGIVSLEDMEASFREIYGAPPTT